MVNEGCTEASSSGGRSLTTILQGIVDALAYAGTGACVYDLDDRLLAWNGKFLEFFPEQTGLIYRGEPCTAGIRRFFHARPDLGRGASIDALVLRELARHRRDDKARSIEHRGLWLRSTARTVHGVGRIRMWTLEFDGKAISDTLASGLAMARVLGSKAMTDPERGCRTLSRPNRDDSTRRVGMPATGMH